MANSEAGSSSDAARASGGEYQVFLNFRGPDTRYGFTDFLYHGLGDAGVRVFMDETELSIGEVIAGNLLRAINNSMIYIPIFSQNYASSKWCLRELAHIIDNVSQSEGKKSILPIFFHVKPEDVKLKTPLYSDALLEHKKLFPDKVEVWREALVKVDEIKGWVVTKDQSQSTIVKLVVKRVLEKLKLKQRLVLEHLVGLYDRVKHLTELLDVNHCGVRLIGIYGMGGIGKTTVAKVVFNELLSHFGKCSSFLENIREKMSTEDGIVQLQKKLLSDIGDSGSIEGVQDIEQGMRRIGEVLSTKKVLVVLDDVDNKDHIKRLIGKNSLHSGSRIISTTRNKTILQGQEFKDEIILYEMLKMDDASALELFCQHAFGKNFPSDDYHWLSNELVSSTGGLPLAVEVIGSLLKEKDKAFWKETKIKLRNVPEEEILKKLRISYEDLEEHQQQIFLDIACFLFNEKKTDAFFMWDSCQFYPERGIDVLTSRCLIKILDDDKFWMHDQLIDMGRRIVHQESPNDPGKRSRLWIAKEALEIIRTKERKDKVQALEIEEFGDIFESSTKITNEEFERFPNLRFLNLRSVTFAGDFAKYHSKLKWISLKYFEADFRADNIYLNDLVVFKFERITWEDDSKAWDLIKRARNLKVLSLIECIGIKTIPDFSECLSLERLTLTLCDTLKRIESFIGKLQLLIELEIEKCRFLTDLPEEVGALGKLERFSLQGCAGLRELPGSLGNLTSLKELDLLDRGIRELPNSIGKLKSLRVLRFAIHNKENHAWHLSSGISTLVNLEELDLSRHNGLKGEIPDGIGWLSSLKILNLKSTGICGIPKTIDMLHHLQMLDLSNCHEIQELPKLPTNLTCLRIESESLLSVPNLSYLTSLDELLLSNYNFPWKDSKPLTDCKLRWIKSLFKLKKLELCLLDVLAPLELAFLPHLEVLILRCLDLKPLRQLPSSPSTWRCLLYIKIDDCEVEDIPLEGLPRLKELNIEYCIRLQRLFIPSESRKLQQVRVSDCEELVEIRVVDLLESLKILSIFLCQSLTRISGLSYLKNLKRLRIQWCNVLTNVEGLDELESLEYLSVERCTSLRRLIDASCTKIPDNCLIDINSCGDYIINSGDASGKPLTFYREWILQVPCVRDLRSLIKLEIVDCMCLTYLPEEVGRLVKLERFLLQGCYNLRELPSSLGNLTSLIELDLSKTSIRELPSSVENLTSLIELDLSGTCIRELPSSLGNLTSLMKLSLSHTYIRELPNSIGGLKSLRVLHFANISHCLHLWEAPSGISMFVNPEEPYLSGRSGREFKIPIGIGELSSLRILSLADTGIYEIPRTINMLHHLQTLDLSFCDEIQELPELPTSLTCLFLQSKSLRSVSNLSNLTNLVELRLGAVCWHTKASNLVTGCNLGWIERLSRLERLNLNLLNVLVPPELASLSHLEELVLRNLDLKPLMQFSSSDWSCRNLSTLCLYSCKVEDISLAGLPQLEMFIVEDGVRLQRLSISLGLTKLQRVDVSGCPKLVEIQIGGLSNTLEDLTVKFCESLTRISGLSDLKNLKTLEIYQCKVLTNVEDLDKLESLESSSVGKCASSRRFIDASRIKIPDDCKLSITKCGDSIKDSKGVMSLNHYREEILRNTSNKSEPGNAELFEATGNRSQMKDERIGHSGDVNGGKTTSTENRKEEKDESGEPANQNDVRLSRQTCEGAEHHESSCEATTEVEDEGDLSSVKRDGSVETERIATKTARGSGTGPGSTPGRGPTERGRGRSIASSSRNSKGSRSGSDAASTSGKGKASNSGRSISSISRSSTTLSSGQDTILSSGRGRCSSSRRNTTKMGTSSSSGRGRASSSRSSSTLSTGRGRGSTSGKSTTVSLGRGTTEMGASLRSGADQRFFKSTGQHNFEYRKGQRVNFRRRRNCASRKGCDFEFRKGCD